MPHATSGVLLTLDAAMKAFVIHIDQKRQAEEQQASFILMKDMDETHMLVKEDVVEFIREQLREQQAKFSFSRFEPSAADRAAE